jgi:hypothetical protein
MPRTYQPKLLADGSDNPKFKYRKRPSGPSGKMLSKFVRADFIAWDGEGITEKRGKHNYIMLCNSRDNESLVNVRGLPTSDCIEYILRVAQNNPKSIHVAFGASYDVNMILADCSRTQIQSVWDGHWTSICNDKYSVNYRARKSFSIRRAKPVYKNIEGRLTRVDDKEGVVLWDVFGFFQSSFVEACKSYLGADYPQLDVVTKMKSERREFAVEQMQEILYYCKLECSMLVALMKQLRDYLDTAQLPIRRWDGAGACAAALLMREKILDHKREVMRVVNEAAQHAYAGGRMELCRYGHQPNTKIYHYDINSAYPTAMCTLPSLREGHFFDGRGSYRPEYPFSIYRITWDFEDCAMYPFFWRAHNLSIYFPQQGSGWYWQPELEAAQLALGLGVLRGKITIHESYHFESDKELTPFEWLPELYEQRKEWKRQGIGAEKVIKLAINSLYGKTAQHAGGSEGKPPRYHQIEWAGYITSYTRAMLYRAIIPALDSRQIIMTATDGIYSLMPLTDLPLGSMLGQWEYKEHSGLTVVQSGVYWTHEKDGTLKPFCRGFDKGSLHLDKIVRAWERHKVTYDASLTRFVTMGSALAGEKSFVNWRKWRTMPRVLSLTTERTKRFDEVAPEDWNKKVNPARGFVHTHAAIPAAQLVGQTMSAKYPLPWVDDGEDTETRFDGAPLRLVEQEAYDSEV